MTTQRAEGRGKRRSAALLGLAVGAALAGMVALAGTTQQAEAAISSGKIVFDSNRTTGTGVNNPTGDYEIFKMNPDGTGVKQLTFNTVEDYEPVLSPDGTRIAYLSEGIQTSNPQGDREIYRMNALDGTGKKNLSNNGIGVEDRNPDFSPDGTRIAYLSVGVQNSNPQGDAEIYRVNVLDGSGKKNLTNNGADVREYAPDFSPDGTKIAYGSSGVQNSNPEGDAEVYRLNALDGTGKKNLTNNGDSINDTYPIFSPGGKKIAYDSYGKQDSNPESDDEVYRLNTLDGTGKKNLTNNGDGINDFLTDISPDGAKIAYTSYGVQNSNPGGDDEIYVMNTLDGSGTKNLTNNGADVGDYDPVFSPGGAKIAYTSYGVQDSNLEGDDEIYAMSALDGSGQKNLTNNGADVGDFDPEWGR